MGRGVAARCWSRVFQAVSPVLGPVPSAVFVTVSPWWRPPHRAPHSMTLVACTRIELGILMPRALAVFMLISSSNLVGCWTGRSAGFAPLRILSDEVLAHFVAQVAQTCQQCLYRPAAVTPVVAPIPVTRPAASPSTTVAVPMSKAMALIGGRRDTRRDPVPGRPARRGTITKERPWATSTSCTT